MLVFCFDKMSLIYQARAEDMVTSSVYNACPCIVHPLFSNLCMYQAMRVIDHLMQKHAQLFTIAKQNQKVVKR